MTRKQILLFLLADLAVMVFAGQGTWLRYQMLREDIRAMAAEDAAMPPTEGTIAVVSGGTAESPVTANVPGVEAVKEEAAPSVPMVSVPAPAEPPVSPGPPSSVRARKTFIYDNTKAKEVQLVGDFNKWQPLTFTKDVKGRWTVSVPLAPGDYSYSFIVDGKTVRDPYQRRTDAKGRSLLTVR